MPAATMMSCCICVIQGLLTPQEFKWWIKYSYQIPIGVLIFRTTPRRNYYCPVSFPRSCPRGRRPTTTTIQPPSLPNLLLVVTVERERTIPTTRVKRLFDPSTCEPQSQVDRMTSLAQYRWMEQQVSIWVPLPHCYRSPPRQPQHPCGLYRRWSTQRSLRLPCL